jgi:hypothetical protein
MIWPFKKSSDKGRTEKKVLFKGCFGYDVCRVYQSQSSRFGFVGYVIRYGTRHFLNVNGLSSSLDQWFPHEGWSFEEIEHLKQCRDKCALQQKID